MAKPIATLAFMVGAALVISALLMNGRQAGPVIDAFGNSTAKVELASLGTTPPGL